MISAISTKTPNSHNKLQAKPVLSGKMRGRAFAVLLILSILSSSFLCGCRKVQKKTITLFALDTYVTITVEGKRADEAVDEAVKLLYELENKFSRTKEGSEIWKLNHSSKESPAELSPETSGLLAMTCLFAEKTDGVFDPTIAPVMDLWGFGTDRAHVPDDQEIEEVLERVDYSGIHILEGNLAYVDEGVEVDLGGVAKGYIGSALMNRIERYYPDRIIVDLGGNVVAFDRRAEISIGIISPSDTTKLCAIYELSHGFKDSVVTSGAYERYFEENGVRYGHIMDTRTGCPVVTDLLSATVISDQGVEADILSTALFAMGCEKAKQFAVSERINCILCADNGTLWVSSSLEGKVHEQEGWTIKYFG